MPTSINTLNLGANWLAVSQAALPSDVIFTSGPSRRPADIGTGTVIRRGSDVIYEPDNIVTYLTAKTIQVSINNTVYVLVLQDEVIFARPPAS